MATQEQLPDVSAPQPSTPEAAASSTPAEQPPAQEHASAAPSNSPSRSRRQQQQQPQQHKVTIPHGAEQHVGVVVSRQQNYGFIKLSSHERRYFFHSRDSDGKASQGATVNFIIARDASNGKDVAVNVQTIEQRAPRDKREENVPGRFTGSVVALPRGLPSLQLDDGMISFVDDAGEQQQALFGTWRLAHAADAGILSLNSVVEFSLARNTATGTLKATAVSPAAAGNSGGRSSPSPGGAVGGAPRRTSSVGNNDTNTNPNGADRAGSPAVREFGRVALLKKEFGFIRQVCRPGDLFFHFTQLDGIPREELVVGIDVEFTVRRDRSGKQSAMSVRRAPPGAVVFEQISTSILRGIVTSPASMGKEYGATGVVPGVIEFDALQATVGAASGDAALVGLVAAPLGKARIVFYPADLHTGRRGTPRPGDNVMFRVKLDLAAAAAAAHASHPVAAALAARRAIDVRLVKCAGLVDNVHMERRFGFINYTEVHAEDSSAATAPAVEEAVEKKEGEETEMGVRASEGGAEEKPSSTNDEKVTKETPEVSVVVNNTVSAVAEPVANSITATLILPPVSGRVFFHFSEVGGGVTLKKGDGVEFTLHTNPKSGDLVASRVRRTSEAPAVVSAERPKHGGSGNKGEAGDAAPSLRKPLNLTKSLQTGEIKVQRMPKMPDGSRGFAGGFRVKGLEAVAADGANTTVSAAAVDGVAAADDAGEAEGEELATLHPLFAGLALRMPKALSVEATPFIPISASSGNLAELNGGGDGDGAVDADVSEVVEEDVADRAKGDGAEG